MEESGLICDVCIATQRIITEPLMKNTLTLWIFLYSFITIPASSQNSTFITARKQFIKGLLEQPPSLARDSAIIRYELDMASEYVNTRLDSTFFWINSTHERLKKINWEPGWGYFYRTRGYYHTFSGKTDSAVADYVRAIQIWEKFNNLREQGIAGTRLAVVLASLKDYDKAFYYLNNSLQIFEKTRDYFSQTQVHNYFADVYRMTKEYPKALDHFRKTVALADQHKLNPQSVQVANVATMYLFNNQPDSATIWYKKAGIDPLGNPASISSVYLANRLAEFYRDGDHPEKALPYAYVALDLARKMKSDLNLNKALGLLYEVYRRVNQIDSALKYYEANIQLTGALQDEESAKRIREVELKYQTEKKETEIARQEALLAANRLTLLANASDLQLKDKDLQLHRQQLVAEEFERKLQETRFKNLSESQKANITRLTQENLLRQQRQTLTWLIAGAVLLAMTLGFILWNNRQLRTRNTALQAALLKGQITERRRVAADLHDSLGSTLSSLRWSIGAIDRNRLEPKEQEVYQHVQSALDQAYNQVRLLSHNLQPEELEKQGLWQAMEQFVNKLNRTAPVRFTLEIPPGAERLPPRTEFELYSICLELANNILRHSGASEGVIRFDRKEGILNLIVTDNGRGMSGTPGKGLGNIRDRVEGLKGTWEISNRQTGLEHKINVPV